MKHIKHLYVTVNSDMKKEQNYKGALVDMACEELNKKLAAIKCDTRVISITETAWTEEIRPRPDNSATWYNCGFHKLSVYYEILSCE